MWHGACCATFHLLSEYLYSLPESIERFRGCLCVIQMRFLTAILFQPHVLYFCVALSCHLLAVILMRMRIVRIVSECFYTMQT